MGKKNLHDVSQGSDVHIPAESYRRATRDSVTVTVTLHCILRIIVILAMNGNEIFQHISAIACRIMKQVFHAVDSLKRCEIEALSLRMIIVGIMCRQYDQLRYLYNLHLPKYYSSAYTSRKGRARYLSSSFKPPAS